MIASSSVIGLLLEVQQDALAQIAKSEKPQVQLRLELLGSKSELAKITKQIRLIPEGDRAQVGMVVTEVKQSIESALNSRSGQTPNGQESQNPTMETFDITMPGELPPMGHLHIVTQAINEITRIFERIGFTRVRHPEVDWDWYPFEALNMPPNHPARDEWETFFIESQKSKVKKVVLTPHTSNGQVREMEKGMRNVLYRKSKCKRQKSK